MIFSTLTLYCNDLEKQKQFFEEVLNLGVDKIEEGLVIKVGKTLLKFIKKPKSDPYHYCFLIPSNKIEEAKKWLNPDFLVEENDLIIHHLPTWNAHNLYFYDGDGNLAEFIVHHDLNNESSLPFDESQILQLNEIGIATNNNLLHIKKLKELGLKLFRGDEERFAAMGNPQGLFILVNNKLKDNWFPTKIFPRSVPFRCQVKIDDQFWDIEYDGRELIIKKLQT